jgi:hypothetical protein
LILSKIPMIGFLPCGLSPATPPKGPCLTNVAI